MVSDRKRELQVFARSSRRPAHSRCPFDFYERLLYRCKLRHLPASVLARAHKLASLFVAQLQPPVGPCARVIARRPCSTPTIPCPDLILLSSRRTTMTITKDQRLHETGLLLLLRSRNTSCQRQLRARLRAEVATITDTRSLDHRGSHMLREQAGETTILPLLPRTFARRQLLLPLATIADLKISTLVKISSHRSTSVHILLRHRCPLVIRPSRHASQHLLPLG